MDEVTKPESASPLWQRKPFMVWAQWAKANGYTCKVVDDAYTRSRRYNSPMARLISMKDGAMIVALINSKNQARRISVDLKAFEARMPESLRSEDAMTKELCSKCQSEEEEVEYTCIRCGKRFCYYCISHSESMSVCQTCYDEGVKKAEARRNQETNRRRAVIALMDDVVIDRIPRQAKISGEFYLPTEVVVTEPRFVVPMVGRYYYVDFTSRESSSVGFTLMELWSAERTDGHCRPYFTGKYIFCGPKTNFGKPESLPGECLFGTKITSYEELPPEVRWAMDNDPRDYKEETQ